MAINRYCASGNLTRDPEMKETKGGMAVLEFGIAVNERRKNDKGEWEDYANFLDCTMFGSRAAAVAPYLKKGTHIALEATLRQDRWEKDGKKRSKVKLIVTDIDFSGNREEHPAMEPAEAQAPQDVSDDDIPF